MKLICGLQNDLTDGNLRKSPDINLAHTERDTFWWPTHGPMLDLFRQIDRYKWPFATMEQYRAVRDAVDAVLDDAEAGMGVPTGEVCIFPDIERAGLRGARAVSGESLDRDPWIDPLWGWYDQALGRVAGEQIRVRGQNRWGVPVRVGWYRLTRPPSIVGARPGRETEWGTMSPEFEAQWGAEALRPIMGSITAGWAHIYTQEDPALLKGATHRAYAKHAAMYHIRQHEAARLARMIFCEWIYTVPGPDCRETMLGVRDAIRETGYTGEAAIAFCGDLNVTARLAGSSKPDPMEAAQAVAKSWNEWIAGPFVEVFQNETGD